MPVYEYLCRDCERLYEILIPLADYDKKVRCKHCNKKMERVIISAPRLRSWAKINGTRVYDG